MTAVSRGHSVTAMLALLLTLAGCSTRPSSMPGVGLREWGAHRKTSLGVMEIGIGEDYPADSWSVGVIRRDLAVLKRIGITRLRVALAWDHIEPSRGTFDWHFWDEFVSEAGKSGVTLLPYVCYTPAWACTGETDCYRRPPRELEDFSRFVRAAAARYQGSIQTWEIWNEPDNTDYWTGSAKEYAELLRAGSRAVRQGNPSAKVVLGGIAFDMGFLRRLFRDEHIADAVDVVNLHNYDETWIPRPIESVVEDVGEAQDIVRRFGEPAALSSALPPSTRGGGRAKHISIWAAEVGYSDYRSGMVVSSDCQVRFDYEHSPRYQAEDLFRVMTLLRSTNDVALVTWYRINDLPSGQNVIGDTNNLHLGVMTSSGAAKPALAALKLANALLGQPLRCIDGECCIQRRLDSASVVHCFETASGDVIAVAWLKTDMPGLRENGGIDERLEDVKIRVPIHAEMAAERDVVDARWRRVAIQAGRCSTSMKILNLRGGETRLTIIGHSRNVLRADRF